MPMRPIDAEVERQATATHLVDASVAARWGPSRLPSAKNWSSEGKGRQARPRLACTHIEVLSRGVCTLDGPLAGRHVSRLRLRPSTGRRHQLRVTLAHLGFPILGDVAYAGDLSSYRLMLHATALTFHAPPPLPSADAAAPTAYPRSAAEPAPLEPASPSASSSSFGQPAPPPAREASGRGRRARARLRRRQNEEAASGGQPREEAVLLAVSGRRLTASSGAFDGVMSDQPTACAGRRRLRRDVTMRMSRTLDATDEQRAWASEHGGARRHVWRHDTVTWLQTGQSAAGGAAVRATLPPDGRFNIITGLPDVSEVRVEGRRLTAALYEAW